jgi:hypothetical protein
VIDRSHEETNNTVYADARNFYKVERWTPDGLHITEFCMPEATWIGRAHQSYHQFL